MIRLAAEADLPQILEIYAPYIRNTTVSFEYTVPTMEEFTDRFRSITAQLPWLVWEEAGRIQGYAYASLPFHRAAYRWCAESSIYLRPEAQGRGIGRTLQLTLEEILKRQGYAVLYAIVTSENTASLAFHKRLGYTVTAELPGCGYKFGRNLSVTWLEKRFFSDVFPSKIPIDYKTIVKNDNFFVHILAKIPLS